MNFTGLPVLRIGRSPDHALFWGPMAPGAHPLAMRGAVSRARARGAMIPRSPVEKVICNRKERWDILP